jgi:hypothetical protein
VSDKTAEIPMMMRVKWLAIGVIAGAGIGLWPATSCERNRRAGSCYFGTVSRKAHVVGLDLGSQGYASAER